MAKRNWHALTQFVYAPVCRISLPREPDPCDHKSTNCSRRSIRSRPSSKKNSPSEARERQAALKLGLRRYLVDSGVLTILTAPFIYAVAIPVFLLDVVASLYQAVCFRVYGVKQVKRRDYVVFDRHRLPYLNVIQKVNCFYCSYANGVIAYVYEIASRTEQYWCPIKHAARLQGTHRRYGDFLEYGDVADYPNSLEAQRTRLRDEGDLPPGPQNPPE